MGVIRVKSHRRGRSVVQAYQRNTHKATDLALNGQAKRSRNFSNNPKVKKVGKILHAKLTMGYALFGRDPLVLSTGGAMTRIGRRRYSYK